jgi:hypothetical protein
MRSLLVLILLWLGFQVGGLLFEGKHTQSASAHLGIPSAAQVEAVLQKWPPSSRKIAENMIAQCGRPDLAQNDVLRWDHRAEVGIVLYRDSATRGLATASMGQSIRAASER